MEVTHHRCPDQFQSYVVNAAWRDPEAEAHAARTFSLWAQDEYQPPVTTSVPDALGRMNHNHETAFGKLKETQKNINHRVSRLQYFSRWAVLLFLILRAIWSKSGQNVFCG